MAKAEDKIDAVKAPVKAQTEPAAPVVAVQVKPKREKAYSFEQWAQLRKKQARHMKGMKTFLGKAANYRYPLLKWDEIFKAY